MQFSLQQLDLIDAPPEAEFDNLSSLAAELLRVPVAHISILDKQKQRIFYKSQYGHSEDLANERELPMQHTYCQHVVLTQAPIIVVDASAHPLLEELVALDESQPLAYLGMPVYASDGQVVGGLCMLQPDTRNWTDNEIESARKLAACASDLIRLKEAMLISEKLRQEQQRFTYAISHDLMSPTNTLLMVLNEVAHESDRLSHEVKSFVKSGQGTICRMKQQVEAVLQYSRAMEVDDSLETISLGELVEDILQDLKAEINASNASITCGELPEIRGSRLQIRTLFLNLISNALKYRSHERSPIVTITSGWKSGHQHSITVKDNGIGIAVKDQTSIFKLFNRLHVHDQYTGTGIGLALCHRVAENHGGSINVSSDGKTGSAFTVKISDRFNRKNAHNQEPVQ